MPRALLIGFHRYECDARTQRHAEALAERGYETDVICAQNAFTGMRAGVNVITLTEQRYTGSQRGSYFRSYLRMFASAAMIALRRSIAKRYDVVIVSSMPDFIVFSAFPIKLLGSKIVLDIRDTMPELYSDKFGRNRRSLGFRVLLAQERFCAAFADRVLAVHEPHRRRLEKAGIPPQKLAVVMNSPDPRMFASFRGGSENLREHFTLVYHGTITHRLGLDIALHAVNHLRDQIPSLNLLVLGEGDYVEPLKSLATRLALNDRVSFMETVPIKDLSEILSRATVGLVPNRASSATRLMLPVKLLEYAMLGIPIIAPRLDTIQNYFSERDLRFFTPGDANDLSAAILEMHEYPDRRVEFALRAAKVASRLNWWDQRQEFYRVIDSLAGIKTDYQTGWPRHA